jgi:hypothetical protein
MLGKMLPFDFTTPGTALDVGCGTAMPYPPGNTGFTEERAACLIDFVLAVARTGTPCALPREPLPDVPTCPVE